MIQKYAMRYDVWDVLKHAHGGQRGAAQALHDLGVPADTITHFKTVDAALEKVRDLTDAGASTRRRDNAIVKAVALGIRLDEVGRAAGVTRERIRQVWKAAGRTDKPWRARAD